MATTTNYGWTTPDDTALVKDGAAAIRSLGTAIDTTVFNNAAASGGKNYTLINSGGTSLSGSTTTISSISGKNSLAILISGLSLTGTQDIGQRLRLNADTGSNYFYAVTGRNNSNVASETGTGTSIFLGVPNQASDTASCLILIEGCNATGNKFITYTFSGNASGTNAKYFTGHARYTGTSAISSISILTDSETYDAGTVFVYGA